MLLVCALLATQARLAGPALAQTPPPTSTNTPTPTLTPTPTPTPTATPTQTFTPLPTFTPFNTPTSTPTPTKTPIAPGIATTITLVAAPNTVSTCPGKITLTATVKDGGGTVVPDGTVVNFITNGGFLNKPTALTTKGIATNVLNLYGPASPSDTAAIYTVAASTALLLSATNVQEACPYQYQPSTSSTSGQTTAGSAAPPRAPIEAPGTGGANSASGKIKPPSTGSAGLRH
ncbi:MAG TPA: hypothetical protein VJB57_14505 [Dehalococcoidia bacterium]|nr:hypothetical protein [Dehalococcoidia bacterium]